MHLKSWRTNMDAIKVSNIILMKDKVISITLRGKGVIILTTIGETHNIYDSQEDAQRASDMFYEQLNKE